MATANSSEEIKLKPTLPLLLLFLKLLHRSMLVLFSPLKIYFVVVSRKERDPGFGRKAEERDREERRELNIVF